MGKLPTERQLALQSTHKTRTPQPFPTKTAVQNPSTSPPPVQATLPPHHPRDLLPTRETPHHHVALTTYSVVETHAYYRATTSFLDTALSTAFVSLRLCPQAPSPPLSAHHYDLYQPPGKQEKYVSQAGSELHSCPSLLSFRMYVQCCLCPYALPSSVIFAVSLHGWKPTSISLETYSLGLATCTIAGWQPIRLTTNVARSQYSSSAFVGYLVVKASSSRFYNLDQLYVRKSIKSST
jgi:hypothetical protein